MSYIPHKQISFRPQIIYGTPHKKKMNMPRSEIAIPPAKYGNPCWEETVDRYVSMDILQLKKKKL